MCNILELRNVYKNFGKKEVLNNISFSIKKGEIVSIIGKNGAGKTTLIKMMIKALEVSNGKILVNNENINKLGSDYYNQIGVVLEGNRNVYWYLSALDNILYYGRLLGMKKADILSKGMKLLKQFNLYEERKSLVGDYSRGMKQKLGIIIAMLNSPSILFLDEPTLGLDVISKKTMIDELKRLSQIEGITIIITSHEFDLIEEISNKMIIIENSKTSIINNITDFKTKNLSANTRYSLLVRGNISNESIEAHFNNCEVALLGNGLIKFEITIDKTTSVRDIIDYFEMNSCTIININNKGISLEDVIYNMWNE